MTKKDCSNFGIALLFLGALATMLFTTMKQQEANLKPWAESVMIIIASALFGAGAATGFLSRHVEETKPNLPAD